MEFEVFFSKYIGEHKMLRDIWKIQTVEAKNEREAMNKIIEEHNRDGKKVNYILSCDLKKINSEKSETSIFKEKLNFNIQRLGLEKEEVIRIVESLYK